MRTRVLRGSALATIAALAFFGCSLVAGLGSYTAGTADSGVVVEAGPGEAGDGTSSDAGDAAALACDASTGVPVALRNSVLPLHLAVSPGGDVYWSEVPIQTPTVGSIVRASPCSGGDVEVIQPNVSFPGTDIDVTASTTTVGAIAVDSDYVYWASGATIQRLPLSLATPAVTYQDQSSTTVTTWIEALAVVGSRLCWIQQIMNSAILVWSVDTSSPPLAAPTSLSTNLNGPTSFYGLASSPSGWLFAATDTGVFATGSPDRQGTLQQIGTTAALISLAGEGTTAYWGTAGAFIYSLDATFTKNGPQPIASNQLGVYGITAFSPYLTWSVGAGVASQPPGGIVDSAIDGGDVHTIVPGQNNPADVRLTPQNIYWIDKGDPGVGNGTVVRIGL